MAPEKEGEDVGARVEKAAAKNDAGNGRSGQQLLSFRSRKLLRNLSKSSDANSVDKRAAAVSFPSSTEARHLEMVHAEPLSTKSRRTLWDPRRAGSEAAEAAESNCEQLRKVYSNSRVKEERMIEESRESNNVVAVAPAKQQLRLPKFKLLETFYEGLEAACCLLRIRRQMCTFRAVCKIVEAMSKRRFLLKHLAQIKHIFSEVLQFEYVRCQDPDTWGERWDLRITLLSLSSDCPHTSSPLKGSAGQTAQTIRRRKEFHARLLNFESSHPEDEDVPLAQLPRRPNSSTSSSVAASPPRDRVSELNHSVQDSISESSAQPPAAEPPPQILTDEFVFSIVKPSRGNHAALLAGTSHFFPSFRPFYSSSQTAQVVDGVAVRRSTDEQRPATLPHDSHFPASFRPAFSARPAFEATEGPSKTARPEETPIASFCENRQEENRVESQTSSRGGILPSSFNPSSPFAPSTPVPIFNSKELPSPKSSSPFPLSTAVPNVNFKELSSTSGSGSGSANFRSPFPPSTPILTAKGVPAGSTDKSCQESQLGDGAATPLPIHTPPMQSPMERKFSSNPESSTKSQCEMPLTDSRRDPAPSKSQGIMRSLRFASPVRGSRPVNADDSDISRRTDSLGPESSTIDTPRSDGNSVKFVHTPVANPSTPSHSLPGAPETPSLKAPVKVAHSQEVRYSPPKRTKFNQRSLFTNDKEKNQAPCSSGSSIAGARESYPEPVSSRLARDSNCAEVLQEEASIPSMLHPTAKGGITESDLDVIQCLPHDIVQSVWEKERKIKDDSSKELVKHQRRQQMMSGVPRLFNQLRLLFQSLNRTVLSEHELIKTLLASHPEITDKVEIEERLKLVIELAPDYIHTRPSQSSELLYRIDKRADVAQIQRRLSGRSGKQF